MPYEIVGRMKITRVGKTASGKTNRYEVHTHTGEQLGIIQWRAARRKYCFEPCFPTVYDERCLRDLAGYIERLTAEHKNSA